MLTKKVWGKSIRWDWEEVRQGIKDFICSNPHCDQRQLLRHFESNGGGPAQTNINRKLGGWRALFPELVNELISEGKLTHEQVYGDTTSLVVKNGTHPWQDYPPPETFWKDCILVKPNANDGYATAYDPRKKRHSPAHRVAWEAERSPIPKGMTIDHLCARHNCVNVDHLEVVTNEENSRRRGARVTHCPQGHPYVPANIIWKKTPSLTKRDGRSCRTCHNEQQRARYAAKRKAEKDAKRAS